MEDSQYKHCVLFLLPNDQSLKYFVSLHTELAGSGWDLDTP